MQSHHSGKITDSTLKAEIDGRNAMNVAQPAVPVPTVKLLVAGAEVMSAVTRSSMFGLARGVV